MKIEQNIPLKDKNWFCTGGAAKFYCEPGSEFEFVEAVNFAREKNQDIFVLGLGANVLVSDDGFDGLLIRPVLNQVDVLNDGLVRAGAGVKIQDMIDFCLDHKLLGLEEFSGIPGTVGGSVFINIHYLTHFLADFLVEARVVDRLSGKVFDVDKSWFNFGYDESRLFDGNHFLVNATFKLKPGTELEAAYCKGRSDETIRHRNRRYPMSNTCGSFFRNFHENEVPFLINGKKILFIAYYLDKLGIKGELSEGLATVSHQHVNMIVSREGATSLDIINLARKMQKMVQERFGILPVAECQFIGFKRPPLI